MIYIPRDIVVNILQFVTRGQFKNCALVNKLWRNVYEEISKSWAEIQRFIFVKHKVLEHSYDYPHYLQYVPTNEISVNNYQLRAVKSDGEIIQNYKGGFNDLRVLNSLNYPCSLYSYDMYYQIPTTTDSELIEKIDRDYNISIIYEVNLDMLSKILLEEKSIPQEDNLLTTLQHPPHRFDSTGPSIPSKYVRPQKQPSLLSEDFTLYKYQLDALAWMKSIEDEKKTGLNYSTLRKWKHDKSGTILVDYKRKKFVHSSRKDEYSIKLHTAGGILGDEMGLGKTVEILSLILANPCENKDKDEEHTANNKLYKSKATLILCPSHLAHQWHETIQRMASHIKVYVVTTVPHINARSYHDFINADVVIMSYQLMKNPGYFYICSPNKHNSIFSNDHHQRHRWLDSHLNEIKKETDTQKIMQPIMDHFLWHRIVVDEAHESLHDNFDSSQIELLQANFFWFVSATPFRLYNNKVLMQKLLPVEFNNYRFSYDDFDFYMNSYLLWRNTKESVKDEYEIPAYVEDIVLLQFTEIEKYAYDNSCSRCIRNYGCFDGDMPLTEYRKYLLDNNKSSVESIRESFKTRNKEYYKVQRVYKNEKAKAKKLAEIETQQENLKDNIARTLLKIENLNSIKDYDGIDISNFELPPMMSDKEEDTDQQTIETNLNKLTKDSILRMKVKQMKDILKQEKLPFPKPANKLDLQKCLISYVDNKEKAKKETETENQVKQEKGKENEKNGTKKVKKTKLDETKKEKDNKSGNDKQAKRKHSGDDDYEENPDSPKKKAKRSKKLNKFDQVLEIQSKFTEDQLVAYYVEKYGTKIGNLLKYLRKVWKEDPTARFIIFTSEVFNIIASMLHDNGIAFANVIGNVMQREKALKTFKNSELKVIMLDTNSTVSGSNLIEASYVILMDPVQGTKEQVVTTESQAIGRAHRQGQHKQVTVVRFIMQDTSEYESYLRVYNVPAACPDPEELIQPPQLLKRQSSISILMPDATRKNKK